MMNLNDMMGRCMEMMGGDTMGNNIVLILLFALLLVWVIGLGAAGAIGFWAVRKLAGTRVEDS